MTTMDPLLQEYAEAQLVVRVTVSEIFRNCPRYVHRYEKIQTSGIRAAVHARELPLRHGSALTIYKPSCRRRIRARVEREGGLISRAEYEKYINDVEDRESSDLLSSDE